MYNDSVDHHHDHHHHRQSQSSSTMVGSELICLTPNKMEFIYDVQKNIMPPIHHNEICYSGSPDIDGECDIGSDDGDDNNDRSESNNFIVKHAKYKSINQHLKRINVTLALSLTIPIHLRYSLPISYKEFHHRHDYGNGISSSRVINNDDDHYDDNSYSPSINRNDNIVLRKKTLYKRIPLPLPHLFLNRANKLIKNNERYISINKVIKREDHNHYNTKKFTNVYYDTTRLNHTGNYDDYYRLFINHYHYIDIDYSKVQFLHSNNHDSMYVHIPMGNSDNLIIIFTSTICIIVFTSLYLFYIIYNIKRLR